MRASYQERGRNVLASKGWRGAPRFGIVGTFCARDRHPLRQSGPRDITTSPLAASAQPYPAGLARYRELNHRTPNYGPDELTVGVTNQVGITERIVLAVIVFGLIVTLIWLKRALSSYPQDPAQFAPGALVERDLSHHSTPPKLGWNWGAFMLGPVWYFGHGLWVHAVFLTVLIALSGGILLPFVMLYGALKANETLEDARLARHSAY
jgi:hypothetical protein